MTMMVIVVVIVVVVIIIIVNRAHDQGEHKEHRGTTTEPETLRGQNKIDLIEYQPAQDFPK